MMGDVVTPGIVGTDSLISLARRTKDEAIASRSHRLKEAATRICQPPVVTGMGEFEATDGEFQLVIGDLCRFGRCKGT